MDNNKLGFDFSARQFAAEYAETKRALREDQKARQIAAGEAEARRGIEVEGLKGGKVEGE